MPPPARRRPCPAAHRAGRLLRRLALAAGLAAAGTGALAQPAAPDEAEPPADCRLLWQIRPLLDTAPRQLELRLRFEAGGRPRSTLRLPAGWDGVVELTEPGQPPRLQPVAGQPQLRSLDHGPGERVQLRWRLTPPPGAEAAGSVRLAGRWFALVGGAALPVPDELDERSPAGACVGLGGLGTGSRWASSHGSGEGAAALLRIAPGPQPLRQRVQQALYAGGDLQLRQRDAHGVPLTAALPRPAAGEPAWPVDADALADAGAQALAAQRRAWGDGGGAPWLLLALPGPAGTVGAAPAHQALLLQAGADTPLPSPGVDAALYGALARARVADRFGPLAYSGRGDAALRAWFSEGLADFLAHRALLRDGRWSADDYARALHRKLDRYLDQPERGLDNATLVQRLTGTDAPAGLAELPAARGEWLALHWHAALRAAGQPGLEAVLQRLQVPAAQARREGPLSAPLATHRLLAALRRVLDEQAMADLGRRIDRGEPFDFGPQALGPCFRGQLQPVPSWRLGFDPASLTRGEVAGVEPGGPAEAAGLRDGMALAGHALQPGDASVPVRLQLREPDGRGRELRYLPAGEPLRPRPRYTPLAQALDQPACQGWLGLGPEALQASAATRAAARDAGQALAPADGRGALARTGGPGQPEGPGAAAPRTGKAGQAGGRAKAGKAAQAGQAAKGPRAKPGNRATGRAAAPAAKRPATAKPRARRAAP